ncbi:N-acetyltransferase family protein [Virgibacillus flavescens]|uniref:GNAT family N-acetyltransferase n=1 Tax=Virgibacillus flavescens TaxID=1611422 RepID=UPI003D34AE99
MYKIRVAQPNDYEIVRQLNHSHESMKLKENEELIEESYYKESLSEDKTRWYVVEKTGKVLAFIFFVFDVGHGKIDLKKLTIDGDYKKKGLNEHLYKKLEQAAERNNVNYIQAEISEEQHETIFFMEQKGWKKEGNFYVRHIQ